MQASLACSDMTLALFGDTFTPHYLFVKDWTWGANMCRAVNMVQVRRFLHLEGS